MLYYVGILNNVVRKDLGSSNLFSRQRPHVGTHDMISYLCHIRTELKWYTTFLLHFHQWKLLYFASNFTQISSIGTSSQLENISSDNDLAPKRRQAIIWTNYDVIHWRVKALLGLYELNLCQKYAIISPQSWTCCTGISYANSVIRARRRNYIFLRTVGERYSTMSWLQWWFN